MYDYIVVFTYKYSLFQSVGKWRIGNGLN